MREMKDSGYQWIREIPTNWKTTKLLYSLRAPITDGPHETPILVDDGIPFISIDSLNDTEKVDLNVCKKFITKELYDIYYKKAKLEKGDILFSKAATIGKTAIVDDELFMVWSPLAIIKADYNKINNRFLYHLLNCKELITNVSLMGSYSTQINVGMRELEKAIIPTPSLDEQKAIAAFLDKKCSEIDIITKDIEKQIDILEDYKKSVITEAVTKGLNPNVEMKDSGMKWLGNIPKESNISKLKYVCKFVNGDRGSNYPSGNDMVDVGVIFLSSNNIHNYILDTSPEVSKYITYERYKILSGAKIKINDIIYCLRGSVGNCSINKDVLEGTIASSLVCIRPNNIKPDLLNFILHSNIIDFQNLTNQNGSCAQNLSAESLSNYAFVDFSSEEQNSILKYLSMKCSEIDKIISDKQKQLEILADYKKSLIYEYVTGKKEVPTNA